MGSVTYSVQVVSIPHSLRALALNCLWLWEQWAECTFQASRGGDKKPPIARPTPGSTGSHFLLMTSSSIFTPDSLVNFLPMCFIICMIYLSFCRSFLLTCWGELHIIALHPSILQCIFLKSMVIFSYFNHNPIINFRNLH